VKSRTEFRVLLFDPDLQGRQQVQAALKQSVPELRLTLRARSDSFIKALTVQSIDAVILGLPIEHQDLIAVLLTLANYSEKPPLLFIVGDKTSFDFQYEHLCFSKEPDQLAKLAQQLPRLIRIARIGLIQPGISSHADRADPVNQRTYVAEKMIESLGRIGIKCMYFSIDPLRRRWMIRSSTFPDDVIRLIGSLEAKGGQVSPSVEQVPPHFRSLLSGHSSLAAVTLRDLLRVLMPWASERDSNRLQKALGLDLIYLAPVVLRNQVHGVLALGHELHEIEQEAVQQLITRFTNTLRQATAIDELRQQAQGLLALQRVLVSVSSTLDTSQLTNQVLDFLAEVVAFDGARVYVIDEELIKIRAVRGSQPGIQHGSWRRSELGDQGSDFVRSLHAEGARIHSEVADHSTLGEPGSQPDWCSWIAAPIRWHGQISGMLTLSSKLPGFFQPLHLEITKMVAQQLGVTLENARLLEASQQKAEKLKIVHEIGRSSISLLDIQHLVFEAAQRVIQVFHYDQVGIFMVEADELVPEIYLYGEEMRERTGIRNVALNSGSIFDEAVRANVPVILQELEDHSALAFIPGTRKARSAMLIPLSIKGAVVGVMLALSHRINGVEQDDVEILQVLAAQLGISLVNARLFSEVRAHAAKLEQRVAERTDELRSQKERTEAILRSVADAVMALDLEGRLVLANPMAQSLLSGPWSEQLYQHIVELQQDAEQDQASWEFGPESFEALASKVELEGRVIGTVIALRNITRLKELDRLKSQFVATVSHELRTPLANIKLYLSLLRRSKGERDPHYFQTLVSETDRLTSMIEDLLDLSRLDGERQIEFRPLQLGELVDEIVAAQRPICAYKRLTLDFSVSGQASILGNRDRLIQVFTNLMANAIAYTPTGGTIRIRLLPIEFVQEQAGVVVEVEDTGMGIPAEELPYVFDRFYRGRMAQQLRIHGSGLGLAIVSDIVEGHGGTIGVSSRMGQGTCFRLWLPIVDGGER
jgi:two-component system phosphate regulon sensor histidine kinase PhoR